MLDLRCLASAIKLRARFWAICLAVLLAVTACDSTDSTGELAGGSDTTAVATTAPATTAAAASGEPAPATTAASVATDAPAPITAAPPPTTEERTTADEGRTAEEAAALLAEYGVEECFLTSMGPCDLDWHTYGLDGCVLSSSGPCDKDGVWFCHDRQTGWAPCDQVESVPAPGTAPAPAPAHGTGIECPAGMTPVPPSHPDRAGEGCWVDCDESELCEPPPEPPSDVRRAARRILAGALSVESDALALVHASPARWGSSALGCGVEGYGYTAALEYGWRFRYEHRGRTYFVHMSTEWDRLRGIVTVNDDRWRKLDGEPCVDYRSGSDTHAD